MGRQPPTTARDREIFLAFEQGVTIQQLVRLFGLAEKSVRAVLASERNRRSASPDKYYAALRNGKYIGC
jgi:Mor family transcriptional regulator